MKQKPILSVLMPVYNGEKLLSEAIKSILNQSFRDFELLIINDGSKDNSLNIIKKIRDNRIYIINKKHTGFADSLNQGIKLAKGKYIARMDCDDRSSKDRFRKQTNYLESNPKCDVIAAKINLIDKNGKFCGKWDYDQENILCDDIKKTIPRRNCIAHPTTMFRAEILKKYKYNYNLYPAEDYDLWLRLYSDNIKIEKLNEELLAYRIKESSDTTISLIKGSYYKHTKIRFLFLLSKILKFKFGMFEIKVFIYSLQDIFLLTKTVWRKIIFDLIKIF